MSTPATEIPPTPEKARADLDAARERFARMEDALRRGIKDAPGPEEYSRALTGLNYLEKALEGAEAAANREARKARDEKAAKVRTQTRRALKKKADAVLQAKAGVHEAIANLVEMIDGFNDEAARVGAKVVELRLPEESLDAPDPESIRSVIEAAPHVPFTTLHPSAMIQKAVEEAVRGLDAKNRQTSDQLVALRRMLDAPTVAQPVRHFYAIMESLEADEK